MCFPRGETGAGVRGDRGWAAATVLRGHRALAHAQVIGEADAPYAPGLLALREGALLETAVRALAVAPDVLLVDATGRDHPRRAGLALHLGAVVGLPTVGVTHQPLLAHGAWPDDVRGATAPLLLDGTVVGMWLRTRPGARPLAVHAAWQTDVNVAVAVVLAAARGSPRERAQAAIRGRGAQLPRELCEPGLSGLPRFDLDLIAHHPR